MIINGPIITALFSNITIHGAEGREGKRKKTNVLSFHTQSSALLWGAHEEEEGFIRSSDFSYLYRLCFLLKTLNPVKIKRRKVTLLHTVIM